MKGKKMINKSVEQSQTIRQINRNNRDFIYNSVYTNDKNLMCVSCEKVKEQCYINKWSNLVKCNDCLKQIEQPI